MDWPRILAYITGTVDKELLVRNEYLVAENRILKNQIKGRLLLSKPFRVWMDTAIADLGLTLLPITLEHAERQSVLPGHHRDPFDRLLISQALVEGIPIVGGDAIFDAYGVNRIWN